MADQLEIIDNFIQRNQEQQHQHIDPPEARAFYAASVEGTIGSVRSLEGQKIILGCLGCSVLLSEVQPGTPQVGRHAVPRVES